MRRMTNRERVLTAINRQQPDKVPKTASFTAAIMELFKQKTGGKVSPHEYFKMEPCGVGFKATEQKTDFRKFFDDLPQNAAINEWGTAHVPGRVHHFTHRRFPMEKFDSAAQVEEYPWPDMKAPYRHAHLEEQVKKLHDNNEFVGGSVAHIFETAWQVRGMDTLLMDFVMRPAIAAAVLDHITDLKAFVARRMAEANVDMLHCGDDVGMQDRMMMSPDMWREWFKPRWTKVIAAAREVKPGIHAFYHSDGFIEPIIPDLIEIGITVLNPVQPECMDPANLKKEYGDRLAFWGTIGTQTTMPFGTPEEVRQTVKERIETVGKGGGLVLAPTHILEPEVPWENIVAFFDAVEEFGRYE
ncbi:MAG: uroporphyrinogen decarboxylase family protein [Planctomycetota bacterium]